MKLVEEQYDLARGSREVVLKFLSNVEFTELVKPNAVFNNKSIISLLVHICNTYLLWLKNFGFSEETEYIKADRIGSLDDLRIIYADIDTLVMKFLDFFPDLSCMIEGEASPGSKMKLTALELITHVITHEFHHKGQVMTMARQLGFPPPDADIIRFN